MESDDKTNGSSGIETEQLLQEITRLQTAMIEQEKLASIGHLTAGIIHEIKNPMNFIINFSKISLRLNDDLNELKEKLTTVINKDDFDELDDIQANLQINLTRIAENGARAMRIMMNMLAQSRTDNSETFEPTDLNQLVDDFTKLAYQGMRGENSGFNLSIKTEYDNRIGKVNIDAHDMSRAILNIVNNACYAMEQKKKQSPNSSYSPQIQITTRLTDIGFAISIKDNGTGMPEEVKAKIFKPFFTTKPGGEGTGLGLSMTYDIVTKIHKGTLEVNAEEGNFTEFIINIPVN